MTKTSDRPPLSDGDIELTLADLAEVGIEWTAAELREIERHLADGEEFPSAERIIELCMPVHSGPTWERDAFGRLLLPELTLGWQIAAWCADWMKAEDGGPWRFTLEQLRFVLWWYAVDDTGRFVYRKGTLQRMKGWGKDPLLAVLCLVELCGPSRFSHFDPEAKGGAMGMAHPQAYVQVTAVNQAQTGNTMDLIPALISDEMKVRYDLVPSAEIIRANGGKQKLIAVTSSYRALEGKRTTFTLLNETHHWVKGNKGHKMYETIDGNATKKDSRYLAITNAYDPGEDSVGERMHRTHLSIVEGRSPDIGVLYDSLEAHAATPLYGPILREALARVRGDALWLRVETLLQSIFDPDMPPSRSRRMWLNQIVAAEDNVHGPETWDPLGDEDLELYPGDEIVVGFDGGKTDDATAIVIIRIIDKAIFLHSVFEQPELWPHEQRWEVDRNAVDSAVHEIFATYKVRGFYCDVALWESYIEEWRRLYGDQLEAKATSGHPLTWDMRSSLQRSTRAHERLVSAIFNSVLRHDGNRTLRRHVLNAKRRHNNFGLSFGKESKDSSRKVDAYAALMLAHEALTDLLALPPVKKRTGRGYFL